MTTQADRSGGIPDKPAAPQNANSEPEETKRYLTALFGQKQSDAGRIVIWSMTGSRGNKDDPTSRDTFRSKARYALDVPEAIRAVEANPAGWNVYAGLSTIQRELPRNGRGKLADTHSLTCLWADVDFGTVGHKSATNPKTIDEARKIVDATGVRPSMLVNSGGGIHAYWLFPEPWIFETDDDRQQAQAIARGWQVMIQSHAQARGVTVDSTHDITRVLRVAGTLNVKPDAPARNCRIVELNDARFEPSDLQALITPEAAETARQLGVKAGTVRPRIGVAVTSSTIGVAEHDSMVGPTFVLRMNADPPAELFTALSAAEPRFFESFNRTRRDFPRGTSQSEFDMSLARFAVMANWSDQQIVDLLVACRNKHGEVIKRVDYFRRTLVEARSFARKTEALGNVRERAAGITPDAAARSGNTSDAERVSILDTVSDALGVRIERVVKYKSDPPKYRLITSKGEIELGTVENLIGQTQVRNAVASADGYLIPKLKQNDWDCVAQSLLDACESVDVGPESTDKGRAAEWLNIYLDDHKPGLLSSQLVANQVPYFATDDEQSVCFFLAHFREWVFRRQSERLSSKELGVLLRKIGVKPGVVAYKDEDDERTTRNVWCAAHQRSVSSRRKLEASRAQRESERSSNNGSNGQHETERLETEARKTVAGNTDATGH